MPRQLMQRLGITRLTGEPAARGAAHGRALSGPVHAFLDDGLARLSYLLARPQSLAGLEDELRAYAAAIERGLPALWAEIMAFASAAGITAEAAVLLQTRREVIGYTKFSSLAVGGDCTSMATTTAGQAWLAQTIDLPGEMHDQLRLLEICGPDIAGGHAYVLSFTGLAGYLGMNAAGVAVGLNLVLGGTWRPGIPPYLAIRHLVDQARSSSHAIELLQSLDLASSRNFVICDRERAVNVEMLDGELRIIEAPQIAHANHFLAPDFEAHDELNVFARNSSLARLAAARRWLETNAPPRGPEAILDRLAAAPLNVSGPRDMRREKTVAAVVMDAAAGIMHVRPGNPAENATQSFALRPSAAAAKHA